MQRDERGYIVVETLTSFMLFTLLVFSILSLINISVVQARVHYALTETAQAMSLYSYPLAVTGAAQTLENLDTKAGTVSSETDSLKSDISEIIRGVNTFDANEVGTHGEAAVSRVSGWVNDTVDDPNATIALVLDYGLNEGKKALLEQFLRPTVGHFLANGDMDGNAYLEKMQVEGGLNGLQFYNFNLLTANKNDAHNSNWLDKNGDIVLTVQYDVKYSFGSLPLPFPKKSLHITQTVKTKAWLNGDGEGYKK